MNFIQNLTPTYLQPSLILISPDSLVKMGKKLVLLDIDNTLVGWKMDQVDQEILDWVRECHSLGLKTCIISNALKVKRLKNISHQIESDFIQGLPKPFSHMFKKALKKYDALPKETIMIGDQIFTDVLGGNVTKIHTILVDPLTPKDSLFTKLNRFLEKPFRSKSFSYDKYQSLFQFLRFIFAGGSCTLLDLFLHNILMFHVFINHSPLVKIAGNTISYFLKIEHPSKSEIQDLGFAGLKFISTGVALIYGFMVHSRWTFRSQGKKNIEFKRFIFISVIGILLNTSLSSFFYDLGSTRWINSWFIASIIGSGAAAIWNYFGHKCWTFGKTNF